MPGKFEVVFQHPFEKGVRNNGFMDAAQALTAFKAIDWAALNNDVFLRQDEVIEDFYYFDVKYHDLLQLQHALNISGIYTDEEELRHTGPRFTITYSRPVEKISRGFLGLGAEKKVLKTSETIQEGCRIDFVERCLLAFTNNDTDFLENEI